MRSVFCWMVMDASSKFYSLPFKRLVWRAWTRFPPFRDAASVGWAAPASSRPSLVRAVESGRDLAHEAIHLVLYLLVRLEPDVEIEDHLGEAGGLHLFQGVDDALGRAQ